jgi:hypothetical protein
MSMTRRIRFRRDGHVRASMFSSLMEACQYGTTMPSDCAPQSRHPVLATSAIQSLIRIPADRNTSMRVAGNRIRESGARGRKDVDAGAAAARSTTRATKRTRLGGWTEQGVDYSG